MTVRAPAMTRVGLWPSLLVLALSACDDGPADPNGGDPDRELAVELVASGIPDPVFLTSAPDDPRLFVVEREGRVRVIADGDLLEEPFLDLTSRVGAGGSEQGLLSIAFHPEFATNGLFFVYFTDTGGDTRVERFSVSGDPDVADPQSAALVLELEQPHPNHNGGHILFGPDGMLYVALGDGGSGGDPDGHGQNAGTLLGSLLRLDVDGGDPYAVPPDNPWVGDPSGLDEIWAIGLRNPWRITFDPPAGTLYIADVGQNEREEVNAVPAGSPGLNYGWSVMEGELCYESDECSTQGFVLPVLTYETGPEGCAVIGGPVYRGSGIPDLVGHYFYSDWCGGWLRSFRLEGGEAVDRVGWDVGDVGRILSFGTDASGELYLLSSGGGGAVYRVVPAEGNLPHPAR